MSKRRRRAFRQKRQKKLAARRRMRRLTLWSHKEKQVSAEQAENRRKLIQGLDRDAALLAIREFSKLGLFQ